MLGPYVALRPRMMSLYTYCYKQPQYGRRLAEAVLLLKLGRAHAGGVVGHQGCQPRWIQPLLQLVDVSG